jgi:enamine deaminase RidA (YjgF/YER057c/UK114 family)
LTRDGGGSYQTRVPRAVTDELFKETLMPSKPETRIQELHLTLPPPAKPVAKYKPAVLDGHLLYVSGHGAAKPDGKPALVGRVGDVVSLEQAKEYARAVGLNILSTVRNTIGSLDKVKRLVKTLGLVYCTHDFKEQPQVINGFSELMAEVFGEDAGVGARSAIGAGSLPANIPVEVECIFEVTT